MSTTPLNNNSNGGNSGNKWNRIKLLLAVASGAITVEAANLILAAEHPDEEPITAEEAQETANETSQPDNNTQPTPEAEPVLETEPNMEAEPVPELVPEPVLESESEPVLESEDDIVGIIVQEIDGNDIDMEDILLVDDIGTVYTVEGDELQAALIHDSEGAQAIMIDVDGDQVYDVITTPEGDVIAQVPGDIDVSDVELLYAQQHGHDGYIDLNDFDVALNEENPDIQDDIMLT